MKTKYTKTTPKKWSENETNELFKELKQGISIKKIAGLHNRSLISIKHKITNSRQVDSKYGRYNKRNYLEKVKMDDKFFHCIKPKTVVDAFAGSESHYMKYLNIKLISNDIRKEAKVKCHTNAFRFLAALVTKGIKADLVDLDPFGSCVKELPLAFEIAKKGIIFNLGEIQLKRYKRLDYITRMYNNINSLETFTIGNMLDYVKHLANRSKKVLKIYKIKNWNYQVRVYCTIKEYPKLKPWI